MKVSDRSLDTVAICSQRSFNETHWVKKTQQESNSLWILVLMLYRLVIHFMCSWCATLCPSKFLSLLCSVHEGSEEDTFVFPHGNGSETLKGRTSPESDAEGGTLADQSTQTDPGVWTPGTAKHKPHSPVERVEQNTDTDNFTAS